LGDDRRLDNIRDHVGPLVSAVIAATIVAAVIIVPQRPGRHPGETEGGMAMAAVSVDADDP
jgi:hypothetical protein